MYCPKCHAHASDDAKFCSQCGQDLSVPYIEPEPEPEPVVEEDDVSADEGAIEILAPLLPSTRIEDMLDITYFSSLRIATFTLRDAEPMVIAREMDMQTYPFGTANRDLIVVNSDYRYWLTRSEDNVVLQILIAQSAMSSLEKRDYLTAVDALLAVLPEKYHEQVDPTSKKLTATVVPEQQSPPRPPPEPEPDLDLLPLAEIGKQEMWAFRFSHATIENLECMMLLHHRNDDPVLSFPLAWGYSDKIVMYRSYRFWLCPVDDGDSVDVRVLFAWGYHQRLLIHPTPAAERNAMAALIRLVPNPFSDDLKASPQERRHTKAIKRLADG